MSIGSTTASEVVRAPTLRVVSPGPLRGTAWNLRKSTFVGRGEHADVRIDDATVSRRHARIDMTDGRALLVDLGSTAGTCVNGHPVSTQVEVGHGDTMTFAAVTCVFEVSTPPQAPTENAAHRVTFNSEHQHAAQLNNVAGDQHHQYLQTIHAQRESFLRDVAASRSKARKLVGLGFFLFIVGFGTLMWMMIGMFTRIGAASDSDVQDFTFDDFLGPQIGGVPIGLIGYPVAFFGVILMVVGTVLHIVATSRRRRIEREPISPPFVPTTHR